MKKFLLLFLLPIALFSSCAKTSNVAPFDYAKQAAIDDASIQTYLTAHPEITNVKDTLGVYYSVVNYGAGAYPTDASTITANYVGTLLNGTQFGANTSYTQTLGNLILGWRIVLPHVRFGSKVIMLVPSLYGYGNNVAGTIPANSVLIFNLTVTVPGNN